MKSSLLALLLFGCLGLQATDRVLPNPAMGNERAAKSSEQTLVLAGGCFWCTEAVFEQLIGVKSVVSGYAGGTADQAHYEMVGSGGTGHAESIKITFDPSRISYGEILKVFFAVAHDPTQLNRQGPDYGKQYRSAIFYANAQQKEIAEGYIKQLMDAKVFPAPIVTQVTELKGFYPAEDYHQDFVKHHPTHPYVVQNSLPKLEKLKKQFPELVKKQS
jgi:peptide-methionine (S)-S-oxide reductase